MDIPSCISNSNVWEFLIALHHLTSRTLKIVSIFYFSPSNRCVVVLICLSFMTNDVHIFHVLICHLCVLFGKVSVQVFCPFFNWVICFLTVEFWAFFIYSGSSCFVGYVICKYFLQSAPYLFILWAKYLSESRSFSFWCLVFQFYLLWMMLLVAHPRLFAWPYVIKILSSSKV